jgi:hypothetical protein
LKNKKSPFAADRNHLHHLLIDSGLTHFQASAILWFFTVISTGIFLLISHKTENTTSLYILCGLFVLYMWAAHELKSSNTAKQNLKVRKNILNLH